MRESAIDGVIERFDTLKLTDCKQRPLIANPVRGAQGCVVCFFLDNRGVQVATIQSVIQPVRFFSSRWLAPFVSSGDKRRTGVVSVPVD